MSDKKNESIWNQDLIELLREEFPTLGIIKGSILKDVFLQKGKNNEFKLQLGFFEQDIVIYNKKDLMNIDDLQNLKSIKIYNNNKNQKNTLIIPSIIIELKYDGVNTHGIITYSNIASEIKSIFPNCRYLFALRYASGSSVNKLLRNGKNFDNILCFENIESNGKEYTKGQFKNEINKSLELKSKWEALIHFIKSTMKQKSNSFLK